MDLSNVIYLPQLKWKAGEYRSLGTVKSSSSNRVVPLFKIPPAGSFDVEEQRVLTTTEHLKSFGRRMAANWGRRLAFIDAELVDDGKHAEGLSVHPLTELLERARLENAMCGPVVSLRNSTEYKNAVKRFCKNNEQIPICFRVSLSDLEGGLTVVEANQFLASIGTTSANSVLLIDAGSIHFDDHDEFVSILAEQVAALVPSRHWCRVFWSATSFPEKPGLKAGQIGSFAREDWQLYSRILKRGSEFAVTPMFSDYALEFPSQYKPVQVSPTAHLRYSTDDAYVISRGTTVKQPYGYEAIYPVAQNLASSPHYMGPDFSSGDKYINMLATNPKSTGGASNWRWAATDHHLTLVITQLAAELGIKVLEDVTNHHEQGAFEFAE
jgi:Beta protein